MAHELRSSDWSSDVGSSDLRLETESPSFIGSNINGSSESRASFAEVRVPVWSPRTGEVWERAALTGAMRRETSDRFESAMRTETVGLEVRPFKSLLLRATYSTAFRTLLTYRAVQETSERTQVNREEHTSELQSLM